MGDCLRWDFRASRPSNDHQQSSLFLPKVDLNRDTRRDTRRDTPKKASPLFKGGGLVGDCLLGIFRVCNPTKDHQQSNLFLPKVDLNRDSRKIPFGAQLILQESAIGIADILRQVDKEGKLRRRGRKLRYILDFDILTLC